MHFVTIGQPKLSERNSQTRGLVVLPTYLRVAQVKGTSDLQLPANLDLLYDEYVPI